MLRVSNDKVMTIVVVFRGGEAVPASWRDTLADRSVNCGTLKVL